MPAEPRIPAVIWTEAMSAVAVPGADPVSNWDLYHAVRRYLAVNHPRETLTVSRHAYLLRKIGQPIKRGDMRRATNGIGIAARWR